MPKLVPSIIRRLNTMYGNNQGENTSRCYNLSAVKVIALYAKISTQNTFGMGSYADRLGNQAANAQGHELFDNAYIRDELAVL